VSRLVEIARAVVPELDASGDLERLLAERIACAAAAWPDVKVAQHQFVRAIAERLPRDAPVRALEAMQTDDLYLVCGCTAGDAAALAGFEQQCGAAIAKALAATGASEADRADLGQVVRLRLLTRPAGGGVPRIATFSARGSLARWVRVVATREAVRILPRRIREAGAGDNQLASLVATDDDPEARYLKRLYREEFKQAFHAAVAGLGARELLVLRQHAIDGLGVDQLARLHGVHRATAARWVQAARQSVLVGTHRELVRRLRLSRRELASIMRLIQSQLDISLPQILQRFA
jgi:RNA polymerase sigma-70 factor (ECF subfamily)